MNLSDRIEQAAANYADAQAKQWPRRQQEDARKAAMAGFLSGGSTALGVLIAQLQQANTLCNGFDNAIQMKEAFGDVADRHGFSPEKPQVR